MMERQYDVEERRLVDMMNSGAHLFDELPGLDVYLPAEWNGHDLFSSRISRD